MILESPIRCFKSIMGLFRICFDIFRRRVGTGVFVSGEKSNFENLDSAHLWLQWKMKKLLMRVIELIWILNHGFQFNAILVWRHRSPINLDFNMLPSKQMDARDKRMPRRKSEEWGGIWWLTLSGWLWTDHQRNDAVISGAWSCYDLVRQVNATFSSGFANRGKLRHVLAPTVH